MLSAFSLDSRNVWNLSIVLKIASPSVSERHSSFHSQFPCCQASCAVSAFCFAASIILRVSRYFSSISSISDSELDKTCYLRTLRTQAPKPNLNVFSIRSPELRRVGCRSPQPVPSILGCELLHSSTVRTNVEVYRNRFFAKFRMPGPSHQLGTAHHDTRPSLCRKIGISNVSER